MPAPWFLSAPYEWIVVPLLPAAPWILAALCVIGIVVDLAGSTAETPRGRFAGLCLALLLTVIARTYFAFDSWASIALIVAAYGVLIGHGARYGWPAAIATVRDRRIAWLGLLIIAAAFALKCVALDRWPPNLNTYSAMTGEEGIRAIEGHWPPALFGIRGYPLAEGGQSPLHLPILVASLKAFGVGVFSVRFAEVVGSTILLLIFWAWVRTVLPAVWALATLAVFAFSPWHLAQSRFGSFYSLCTALALAMLWLGERTREVHRAWTAWALVTRRECSRCFSRSGCSLRRDGPRRVVPTSPAAVAPTCLRPKAHPFAQGRWPAGHPTSPRRRRGPGMACDRGDNRSR